MDLFEKCKSENREYDEKYPHKEDYKLVADSALRAGKAQSVIRAQFKIALLLDNKRDFVNSIKEYKKLIKIAKQINDSESEAIGYNCISNALFLLGKYRESIKYSELHKSTTKDDNRIGKVISLCNIGLNYRVLGEFDKAIENHRKAYDIAIEVENPGLNSLASGNLGYSLSKSTNEEDLSEARDYIEKYMSFCSDSLATNGALNDPVARDPTNISLAFMQLGGLASMVGTREEAIENFDRARILSWNAGDQTLSNRNKCNIGIHSADLVIADYMKRVDECEPDGKYNAVNRIEELWSIMATLQRLPPTPTPMVLRKKENPLILPDFSQSPQ